MRRQSHLTKPAVLLGVLAFGVGSALAAAGRPPGPNGGGYQPWHGQNFGGGFVGGFGGYAVQGPPPSQPSQGYDLAPAIAQAAFAEAQYENRWVSLQLLIAKVRDDFYASNDYLTARTDLEQARSLFEAARDSVLDRLQNDRTYNDLIAKRTQEQIALKSTAPGSEVRDAVATQKMRYGAMASDMEAVALADDPAVQDARRRLIAAQEKLSLKQKQFELQLNDRPEIAAAREAMSAARANKAGAEGFLRGAEIMRADQLSMYWGNYSGNLVGPAPWGW